jgi:hypothetical protein
MKKKKKPKLAWYFHFRIEEGGKLIAAGTMRLLRRQA